MSERDAFGPNLRRIRIQRGLSLEQLAAVDQGQHRVVEGARAQRLLALAHRHLRAVLRARLRRRAIGVDPEIDRERLLPLVPAGRSPRRAADPRAGARLSATTNLRVARSRSCSPESRSTATAAAPPRPPRPLPPNRSRRTGRPPSHRCSSVSVEPSAAPDRCRLPTFAPGFEYDSPSCAWPRSLRHRGLLPARPRGSEKSATWSISSPACRPMKFAIVIGFLSGEPRQGRMEIGGALLSGMRDVPPADDAVARSRRRRRRLRSHRRALGRRIGRRARRSCCASCSAARRATSRTSSSACCSASCGRARSKAS